MSTPVCCIVGGKIDCSSRIVYYFVTSPQVFYLLAPFSSSFSSLSAASGSTSSTTCSASSSSSSLSFASRVPRLLLSPRKFYPPIPFSLYDSAPRNPLQLHAAVQRGLSLVRAACQCILIELLSPLLTLLRRWWRSWAVSGSPAFYVLFYGIYQYHSLHSKHQPDATSSFVVYSCAKTRPFNLNDMPRYL